MPEWYPTLFATLRYRNASKTPQTTYSALGAVRQVHRWAESDRIDLTDRFRRRAFLADHEISSLAAFLRRKADQTTSPTSAGFERLPSRWRLERARASKSKAGQAVTSGFAYSRITYAVEYLDWLARRIVQDEALRLDKDDSERIKLMASALGQLRPKGSRRSGLRAKIAQTLEEERVFLALAKPGHEENPFSAATAARNYLIAQMLHDLGLRAGELLALKATDFDFASQEVVVERRHNDPEDPRANQPVAKTDDRRLPISDDLASLVIDYIANHRKKLPRARYHAHLLVSTRNSRAGKAGEQMSRQALAKVIGALSRKMPDGSQHVHPHILRHNAASRMASYLYERGDSEAKIEDSLNAKFGWAQGSGTARVYIDRVIKSLAAVAERAMQAEWKAPRVNKPATDK
jgi:integrase